MEESNYLIEHGIIKNSAIEDKRRASKVTQMSTTKENETKRKLFSIWKTTTQHLQWQDVGKRIRSLILDKRTNTWDIYLP